MYIYIQDSICKTIYIYKPLKPAIGSLPIYYF